MIANAHNTNGHANGSALSLIDRIVELDTAYFEGRQDREAASTYTAGTSDRMNHVPKGVDPLGTDADYHYRTERNYFLMVERARAAVRNHPLVEQGVNRLIANMRIGDYTLVYRSLDERASSNATEIRATLDVIRGDRDLGTLRAGKNAYTIEQQVSNEVGIRSDRLTGEDLFVIAEQIDADGSVYFRVFVKPLVNLIWLAGLVFLIGSMITLWPDRREQRRLVARAAEVGIPATP